MQDEWQKKKVRKAKRNGRSIPKGWKPVEPPYRAKSSYKRKTPLYAPPVYITPEERWERLNSLIAVVS